MKQEYTPGEIVLNRTVFRLTQAEAICALQDWITQHGAEVPKGTMSVFFPSYDSDKSFEIALEVHHHDPPPERKD